VTKRFGLYGSRSRDFITSGGQILTHDDRAEMEFLFNGDLQVRELPRDIPTEQTISIRHHPSLAAFQWPLTREQFS